VIEVSTGDGAVPARGHQRDDRAVAQFVERFASVLFDAGWPRMAARVFVVLLASESSRLTAAELAERLQISPAAVSGAVRFLIQLDLARRESEPGSRRDYYVVDEDVWFHVIATSVHSMTRWGDHLGAGLAAVGEDSPAGARLSEMLLFFDFLRVEVPEMMDRWRAQRAATD
jgi:predicted transcriptional regulator